MLGLTIILDQLKLTNEKKLIFVKLLYVLGYLSPQQLMADLKQIGCTDHSIHLAVSKAQAAAQYQAAIKLRTFNPDILLQNDEYNETQLEQTRHWLLRVIQRIAAKNKEEDTIGSDMSTFASLLLAPEEIKTYAALLVIGQTKQKLIAQLDYAIHLSRQKYVHTKQIIVLADEAMHAHLRMELARFNQQNTILLINESLSLFLKNNVEKVKTITTQTSALRYYISAYALSNPNHYLIITDTTFNQHAFDQAFAPYQNYLPKPDILIANKKDLSLQGLLNYMMEQLNPSAHAIKLVETKLFEWQHGKPNSSQTQSLFKLFRQWPSNHYFPKIPLVNFLDRRPKK